MSASLIVLADAQATPVNHTFTPIGPDSKGVFWFEELGTGPSSGNRRISMSLKRAPTAQPGQTLNQRVHRIMTALHLPTLDLTNPSIPIVAYVSRSFCEYIQPERNTLQDRKDLQKMTTFLQDEAQAKALITTLAMPF